MHTFIKIRRFRIIARSALFSILSLSAVVFAQAPAPVEPKLAVILNSGDASVSLIDMPTRKVIKTVAVGSHIT
jgi:hypothetical protein